MSALSIVGLTVLSVLILLTLLAALVATVYVHLLVRREIAKLSSLATALGATMASNQTEIKSLIQSANGQEITQAVRQFLTALPGLQQSATRAEKTFTLLEALAKDIGAETLHTDELAIERARRSGLLPNAYGPDDGEIGYSQSTVAANDARSRSREGTEEGLDDEYESGIGIVPGTGSGGGPDGSEGF